MPKSDELVSVIIPTHNRLAQCSAAVESVLSQSHKNVEITVVDDGSTDNTQEIIPRISDRVRFIKQENSGVSKARNRGLRAATGDFIAFLDDDDTWLSWKLEAQLSVLRSLPSVGMVWSDMNGVDTSGKILYDSYLKRMYSAYRFFDPERQFSIRKTLDNIWKDCPERFLNKRVYAGNIFSWMFMGNLVHTSTVLLRHDRQAKVGFFDADLLKSGEDSDFNFRTCRLGDVAYMDVPSIRYCIGGADQLTSNDYMIWVARNNLRTIMKIYSDARNEIRLPKGAHAQKDIGILRLVRRSGTLYR